MSAQNDFLIIWKRAALKLDLSKETQDAYWHFTKRLFVVCGRRGSETWMGSDWECLEWWMAEQKPAFSYSADNVAKGAA